MISGRNLSLKIDELTSCHRDSLPLLIKNLSSSLVFSGLPKKEQEGLISYFENLSVVFQKHREVLDDLRNEISEQNVY